MKHLQELNLCDGLMQLINSNAPYWEAEAEVVRTYWNSPIRNKQTDQNWLSKQMYKELWDGCYASLQTLNDEFMNIEQSFSRVQVRNQAEILAEEFEHYCLFADVYNTLSVENAEKLTPMQLKEMAVWKENDDLMSLRAGHCKEYGDLGKRAHFFTEGGYCTLYSEGMKLEGTGPINDLIAKACKRVYEDEFDHMLLGIVSTSENSLSDEQWQLMIKMTTAQMKFRIHMRNAQFGYPVSEQRIRQLCNGECKPMAFDFDKALKKFNVSSKMTATT